MLLLLLLRGLLGERLDGGLASAGSEQMFS